jgi:hypothetical protein
MENTEGKLFLCRTKLIDQVWSIVVVDKTDLRKKVRIVLRTRFTSSHLGIRFARQGPEAKLVHQ